MATASGSTIIMGEYAVLMGHPIILKALPYQLTLHIKPSDQMIIDSDIFGVATQDPLHSGWRLRSRMTNSPSSSSSTAGKRIFELPTQDPLHSGLRPPLEDDELLPPHIHIIMTCYRYFLAFYDLAYQTCHIDIQSDISTTHGFGSSAALIAALLKGLCAFFKIPYMFSDCFEIGHKTILTIQGRGSGADLASSLSGVDVCLFDPRGKTVQPWSCPYHLGLIYVGYKTPTAEVLRKTHLDPDVLMEMGRLVETFIMNPDLCLVAEYQNMMRKLGVSCEKIEKAIDYFAHYGYNAKISGSGLGDCVIGLSPEPAPIHIPPPPFEYFAL